MKFIEFGICAALLLAMECLNTSNKITYDRRKNDLLWSLSEGFQDDHKLILKGEGFSVPGLKTVLQRNSSAQANAHTDAERRAIQICRSAMIHHPGDETDFGITEVDRELTQLVRSSKKIVRNCKYADSKQYLVSCKILVMIERTNIRKTCELNMAQRSQTHGLYAQKGDLPAEKKTIKLPSRARAHSCYASANALAYSYTDEARQRNGKWKRKYFININNRKLGPFDAVTERVTPTALFTAGRHYAFSMQQNNGNFIQSDRTRHGPFTEIHNTGFYKTDWCFVVSKQERTKNYFVIHNDRKYGPYPEMPYCHGNKWVIYDNKAYRYFLHYAPTAGIAPSGPYTTYRENFYRRGDVAFSLDDEVFLFGEAVSLKEPIGQVYYYSTANNKARAIRTGRYVFIDGGEFVEFPEIVVDFHFSASGRNWAAVTCKEKENDCTLNLKNGRRYPIGNYDHVVELNITEDFGYRYIVAEPWTPPARNDNPLADLTAAAYWLWPWRDNTTGTTNHPTNIPSRTYTVKSDYLQDYTFKEAVTYRDHVSFLGKHDGNSYRHSFENNCRIYADDRQSFIDY